MTAAERSQLIARYSQGYEQVVDALDGFPSESLSAHPIAGKWSAREIVHHLGDSESISAARIRTLLCHPHPLIHGYDQEAYARILRYNEREDLRPSLDAFRAARANTVPVLESMSEDDWTRQAWHTESGPYSAETWLRIYATHAHDHADQIRRLREKLGH